MKQSSLLLTSPRVVTPSPATWRAQGREGLPSGPTYWFPIAARGSCLPYSVVVGEPIDDEVMAVDVSCRPSGQGELAVAFVYYDSGVVSFWGVGGCVDRSYEVLVTVATRRVQGFTVVVGLPIGRPVNPSSQLLAPSPFQSKPSQWRVGMNISGPSRNLEPINVLAAGTSQLSSTIVKYPAKIFVNAYVPVPGGSPDMTYPGVMLPPRCNWDGDTLPASNFSGSPVYFYAASNEVLVGKAAGVGLLVQDQSPVTFWRTESGAINFS